MIKAPRKEEKTAKKRAKTRKNAQNRARGVLQSCSKRVPKKSKIMATTKFYLDQRKGSAPFPMKVRLTHAGETVFILLNVKLDPEQWVGEKVVKHPNAQMMTNQLVARKSEIDCLLFDWERTGKIRGKSAKEVKKMLEVEISGEPKVSTGFGIVYKGYMNRKDGNTKKSYENSYKALAGYCDIDNIPFEEITSRWLEDFDNHLINKGNAQNTRNMCYRYMRAVFNYAIDEGMTQCYPFRKFKIKRAETKKKSLTIEQLRELWNWSVDAKQERYLDLFKLVFLLRGMNLIDLVQADLSGDRIEYDRSKTKKPYSIKVEPEIRVLIDKLQPMLLQMNKDNYRNYEGRANKALKTIGTCKIGKRGKKEFTPILPKLSMYWARHSFATIGHYECGISMDLISDMLGHSNGMAVTNIYIRKNEKVADEAARKIIDKVLYNK